MDEVIQSVQLFLPNEGQENENDLPSVAVVNIYHPTQVDAIGLAEGVEDQDFQPFAEDVEQYAGYKPMVMSQDALFLVGNEFFTNVEHAQLPDLVIIFDDELKGFMPFPLQELAAFMNGYANQGPMVEPTRQEMNDFLRLQTKENELVDNPELQKALDLNELTDDNMEEMLKEATFLTPVRLGKKNLKKSQIDFFLLTIDDEEKSNFMPLFTDWGHLNSWYFSQSGEGFKKAKDHEIAAIPLDQVYGVIDNADSNIQAAVINPVTNDFVIQLEADNED
ncbi:MAG: SseB family protein [Lactobacillaceae bacterium]|jgi:hypothetical protein|nr:SseB family protein [Lactobacillaceae bacterium]